jgi:selT/selW/selH-like putative selenoprotein
VSAEIKDAFPDADVELIDGGRGVFDVTVDGELLYSRHQTRRHMSPGEVVSLLNAR